MSLPSHNSGADALRGNVAGTMVANIVIPPLGFQDALARFKRLIATNDAGNPFVDFETGLASRWEGYKLALRQHALTILDHDSWQPSEIGSGTILARTIAAIEIKRGPDSTANNLVAWPNRFGHANRDHRALLEAVASPSRCEDIERILFDLYRDVGTEVAVFDRLSVATGSKYPLLAYLFFLKDPERFMPIRPTTFDRAFQEMGIELVTVRNCNWPNYAQFNATLQAVRQLLSTALRPLPVRLIDAHSFCWMLATMQMQEGEPKPVSRSNAGRILTDMETAIVAMRQSVENTVAGSNGQTITRVVKDKNLLMTSGQLESRIRKLLEIQGNKCALTGIPLLFNRRDQNQNLWPSVDRIDSNGHYETDNIQIVCRFINFWKGASDNEEFKDLLGLVRGERAEEPA